MSTHWWHGAPGLLCWGVPPSACRGHSKRQFRDRTLVGPSRLTLDFLSLLLELKARKVFESASHKSVIHSRLLDSTGLRSHETKGYRGCAVSSSDRSVCRNSQGLRGCCDSWLPLWLPCVVRLDPRSRSGRSWVCGTKGQTVSCRNVCKP